MGAVAAVQAAPSGGEVGGAKGQLELMKPAIGAGGGLLAEELAGVLVPHLLQALGDGVQGLLPAYLHPPRVDPQALLRVGALQGGVEAVGVVEGHDGGGPLGGKAPGA